MRRLSSSSTTSSRAGSDNPMMGIVSEVPEPFPASSNVWLIFASVRLFAFLCFKNRRFHLEHNTENRTAINLTTYFDTSTMLPHDVLRNPQSQAGPFFAGGKERLEDAIEIVFSDTHAAVAELNHDRRLQRLLVTRSENTDVSATLDRLLRVDNQVEKHLPQLIGTSPDA